MKRSGVILITASVLLVFRDLLGSDAVELSCDDYPKIPECPTRYDPVCGTNGKDYLNRCHLCRYNGEAGKDIGIKHEGYCTCKDMNLS
ncbi:trypsin inhibitor ClTI-1-like [Scyliorhinus torazame]|uniref:trypsin inhibitor ClTI-1-like n=1 Tax=Scyliorhinus torazame TaxID=75743 RepID=UPI003B5CC6D9